MKPSEDAITKFHQVAAECATKEGASSGDVNEAMAFRLPSTQNGKCFHACLGNKFGVVSSTIMK